MLQVQIICPICFEGWLLHPQCDQTLLLCGNSSKFQRNPEAAPKQPTTTLEKAKLHVGSSIHCGNEGTEMIKWTDSKKKPQHQEG